MLPIWVAQPLIRKEDMNHKAESKRNIEKVEDLPEKKKVKLSCPGHNCTQSPSLKCDYKFCKSCCRKLKGGGCEIHKRPNRATKLKPTVSEAKPHNSEEVSKGSWCSMM